MQNKNQKVQNVAATSFDKTRVLKVLPDQIHRGFMESHVEPRGFLWRLGTPKIRPCTAPFFSRTLFENTVSKLLEALNVPQKTVIHFSTILKN